MEIIENLEKKLGEDTSGDIGTIGTLEKAAFYIGAVTLLTAIALRYLIMPQEPGHPAICTTTVVGIGGLITAGLLKWYANRKY